jgi:transcription antitermination protein NusB
VAGFNPATAARALARRLAVQALYRWQLNAASWQELVQEFSSDPDMRRADQEYFQALVQNVCEGRDALDETLEPYLDRKSEHLDPVEHAVLLVGMYELQQRPDLPFRVVINEAVSLTKRFGATDGYKFVNGVMDRAARSIRASEH